MLIAGITASMRAVAGAATGTTLDFTAGTYTVNGTAYALTDLLETGYELDGTTPLGEAFDPAPILLAGRGLLISADVNAMQPRAKGALLTKLMAPYTAILEFEDIGEFFGSFLGYQAGSANWGNVRQNFGSTRLEFDPPGTVLTAGSPYNYLFAGVNKLAGNVGTADMHIAQNGQALSGSALDGSTFFGAHSITQVFPFGSDFYVGQAGVIVRKLTLLDPQPASALPALSGLTTPGPITDLTVGSLTATTATLIFSPVSGATGYEYWLKKNSEPHYPDGTTVNNWLTVPGDRILTDLTPATQYWVYVRPRNADGPGAADDNFGTTFTTSA